MESDEKIYMKQIDDIPLLSSEEEKILGRKAFKGDADAQKKLVMANLRLVVKIANKYKKYKLELNDLINEGNIGLIKAAERFNPDNASGAKFSTYAAWWITENIQKAIRETSTGIKFPANKYNEMKNAQWNFISFDKTFSDDKNDNNSLLVFLEDKDNKSPEQQLEEKMFENDIKKIIKELKETEQVIIKMRFGFSGEEPMSLSEIGRRIGYTKERVRQIEFGALEKMRRILIKKYEIDYNCAA